MAYNKKFSGREVAAVAVAPNTTTSGALDPIAINATGWGRAKFIFALGEGAADAKLDAKVWEASSSGATYTSIASAELVQVSTGAGSNLSAVLEVAVDQSYPWLKVSGALTSSTWPHAVVVVLAQPDTMPPTAITQQIVSV